jgi:hypothetical protein
MGNLIRNTVIGCSFCQNKHVRGKLIEKKDNMGNPITECRWVCDRCGNVVRRDQKSHA